MPNGLGEPPYIDPNMPYAGLWQYLMSAAHMGHQHDELTDKRLDAGAKWMECKGKQIDKLVELPEKVAALERRHFEVQIRDSERANVAEEETEADDAKDKQLDRAKKRVEYAVVVISLVTGGMALGGALVAYVT